MEDAAAGSWSSWAPVTCSSRTCSMLQQLAGKPWMGTGSGTATRCSLQMAGCPTPDWRVQQQQARPPAEASLTLWPLPAPSPSSLTLGASCSRHQRQPQRPLSLCPPSHGRPSVVLLLIQGQKYLQGMQEQKLRGGISGGVEMEMPAGTCSCSTPVVALCYRPTYPGHASVGNI